MNIETGLALPVLSPIAMSSSRVNLIQTAASISQAPQTIATPTIATQPTVPEVIDPCHQKLGTYFSQENLTEDPADAVVSFIDEYCLEAASYLTSK